MNRKLTVALCCAVLPVALGSLWFWSRPAIVRIPQQEIIGVQTGLGQVLGEETAKVVSDRGHVVVVAMATPAQLKHRSNYLWHAFESELQKRSIGITVVESALNAWNSGSLAADRAAFKELLAQHSDANAIVFLVDLPEWGRVAEVFPQPGSTKIIALDNLRQQMKARYGGFFTSGMLVALIGARTQPVAGTAVQPKTPREWFDKFYQVYTPQNYESLPE